MSIKTILMSALVLGSSVAGFATSANPDAMRAASATQTNTKYASSVSLTKDADGNIVSYHVNGVSSADARILLTGISSPLSTEYTVVCGVTKDGGLSAYMLPTNVATARIIESISQDLVNAGAVNIQITKVLTGRM